MNLGTASVVRANARHLPLDDNSVDLVVTSPPYFALRSYQDGGEHYAGQIGDEPTPAEFVASLLEVTRECMRVLKPSGSLWVNLGDCYSGKSPGPQGATGVRVNRVSANEPSKARRGERPRRDRLEQFTREDAAWLAGVIDSDGSIGIHINKQPEGRSPSFVPWVRIGQMRPEVVERAAEICGTGKVMQDGRGVWNWAASAQQARWVLERIHPWLLIKKRQAWAAIAVARHIEHRNAKGSWRQLTTDDVAYRQRLREAVMAWNKGEADDCPVPDPGHMPLPLYPLAPRAKSLQEIPHYYAQECIGRLGLILRAEVIWSKPNGLPESVTDRVRRSHEQWFHFALSPRYFSAVDEIREEPTTVVTPSGAVRYRKPGEALTGQHRQIKADKYQAAGMRGGYNGAPTNPLGKLPGSVWTVPIEPLRVPDHLGVDHFAAFPTEWPKRIIQGWSPEGGTVLDPFGGTGTTAMVAKALGRHGISVDMSADYCRLAEWRTNDRDQLAKVLGIPKAAVPDDPEQLDLFGGAA